MARVSTQTLQPPYSNLMAWWRSILKREKTMSLILCSSSEDGWITASEISHSWGEHVGRLFFLMHNFDCEWIEDIWNHIEWMLFWLLKTQLVWTCERQCEIFDRQFTLHMILYIKCCFLISVVLVEVELQHFLDDCDDDMMMMTWWWWHDNDMMPWWHDNDLLIWWLEDVMMPWWLDNLIKWRHVPTCQTDICRTVLLFSLLLLHSKVMSDRNSFFT